MNIHIDDTHCVDASDVSAISGNGVLNAILKNRGIMTDKDIDMFLHGDISMIHDPRLMKDAQKAAETIIAHINKGSKICIYSDFDADGFGALITAVQLLERIGADVCHYTNSRAIGFGMKEAGIKEMLAKYPDVKLVVTCDNGIVAYEGTDILNSMGIDVIITDHHEPDASDNFPNAIAVVDPKRKDDTYPFKGLCGAGVIWKVMMLVYELLGHKREETYDMLDVVSMSTVADVVPLIDENRLIVKEGLRQINGTCRHEWDILREVNSSFKAKVTDISAETFGFTFAPQVNACSRMLGNIEVPISLFLSSTEEEKKEAATKMKGVNEERKARTKDQTERAFTLAKGLDGSPVIIVASEIFDPGIVGLVAGRLKEAMWAPAIAFTPDPDMPGILRGSGRSIEGFKMKSVLDEIAAEYPDLIVQHGGHDMACGLSIKAEDLDRFELAMNIKATEIMSTEDYWMQVLVDVDVHDDESANFVADTLGELEPYGCQFPRPIVRLKNFTPCEIVFSGTEKQHVIFKGKNINVKCWNGAEEYINSGSPKTITAYGRLEISSFDGKCELVCDPWLIVKA